MCQRDEHFELPAELAALDAQLRRSARVATPAGLVDRIVAATGPQPARCAAAEAQLDADLRRELRPVTPKGLNDRIVAATAHRLPGRRGVLRFIGPVVRLGLAAAVALGISLGIWATMHQLTATDREVAAIRAELARLEQTLSERDAIDLEVLSLALEVDTTTLAIQSEANGGPAIDPAIDQIQNELSIIEAEAWSF